MHSTMQESLAALVRFYLEYAVARRGGGPAGRVDLRAAEADAATAWICVEGRRASGLFIPGGFRFEGGLAQVAVGLMEAAAGWDEFEANGSLELALFLAKGWRGMVLAAAEPARSDLILAKAVEAMEGGGGASGPRLGRRGFAEWRRWELRKAWAAAAIRAGAARARAAGAGAGGE